MNCPSQQIKMNVFEMLKNNLIVLGISSKQTFNERIALGSLIIGSSVVSHAAFLLYVADDFTDYTQSIYMFSVTLLTAINFANIFLKMTKLFAVFDNLEIHVNECE